MDLRTPEERRRDSEELLQKIQRMKPDLYERVSKVVAGSDEDWFELLVRGAARHAEAFPPQHGADQRDVPAPRLHQCLAHGQLRPHVALPIRSAMRRASGCRLTLILH